jgi:enterochelin esterase-like enzyme
VAAVAGDAASEEPAMGSAGFESFLAELEGLGNAAAKSSSIDAYLAENSVPIIEDTGEVHFLYRGEAEDVGIVGDMIGFRREDPMTRIAGTDLFYYSTRLELDAAVHYGFLVDYAEASADPLNSRSGEGLFGEVSFLEMPARYVDDFSREAGAEHQGSLEEVTWESKIMEGQTRKAQVYLPAGYGERGDRRYPTLYFHDGEAALENGGFKNALDRSIGEFASPMVAVFFAIDPEKERGEFRNPAYIEMFLQELIPLIDEQYATVDHPMARASAGVTGAGDISFKIAFQAPDRVGRVGALWPTLFAFTAEPPSADDQALVIYQKWGAYHLRSPHENFDSALSNRNLQQRLRDLGHRPGGGEVSEGVGWNNYRGYIAEMLRVLFPAG